MKILKEISFSETIKTLKNGGLIIYPTDTVYGLLLDATSETAVKKLIEFKERPAGKAISVFVSDFEMMKKYAEVNRKQEKVLRQILPGPFTVILRSKHNGVGNGHACSLLESEKGTLGIRIPKYDLVRKLVKLFGRPLTATSANLASQSPHYSVESLLNSLSSKKKEMIDLIVDGGKLPINKPSTVVDLTEPEVMILRQGDLDFNNSKKIISDSSDKTKKIAQDIFKKLKTDKRPLFFVIEGELGVGKTIFVKGLGELFGIKNIVSPTYVIYYEYDIKMSNVKCQMSKLIHCDLYNIEDETEFDYLGLEKYFKNKNIICFEWGERLGKLFRELESKGMVVYVKMRYLDERKREIEVLQNVNI